MAYRPVRNACMFWISLVERDTCEIIFAIWYIRLDFVEDCEFSLISWILSQLTNKVRQS